MTNLAYRIAKWSLGPNTGLSSKALARQTLGLDPQCEDWGISYPHDPADFIRCHELVQAVPEARAAVDLLGSKSKKWAVLAARWDDLTAQYLAEMEAGKTDNFGRRILPATYEAMKALGL